MTDFISSVCEASQAHPVLAYFHASWCPHCRQLTPLLDEAAERNHVPVVAIDVDEEPALAQQNGVTGFPDVRLWNRGQEVAGITGGRSLPELDQWLREQLAVST